MPLPGTHHDDVAAATSFQVRNRQPRAVVRAVQVDVKRRQPVRDIAVLHVVPVQADAVIEHQDVQAAGPLHRLIQQRLDRARFRHVPGNRQRRSTLIVDPVRD